MSLSREDILATSIPSEMVDVPEWGGKVIVRGLSASERDAYEASLVEFTSDGRARTKRNLQNVRTSLVIRCLVDEDGKRVFSDSDMDALGAKSGAVIERLWLVARRLSGMGEEAVEAAVADFALAQGGPTSSD